MIQFATDVRAFLPGACKWWIVPPGLSVALVVCHLASGAGVSPRPAGSLQCGRTGEQPCRGRRFRR